MDMHTDTTAHLAAEGAETPTLAATEMREALIEGETPQALAEVAQYYSNCPADPKNEAVAATQAPSLATLLAKRNAMMDAINLRAEGDDAPDDEVTQANEAALAVEQQILTAPCDTADDAVAKVAALVEFIREAGCPDESDVENVLTDIGRVLSESTHPMHGTKVDRHDCHWALVRQEPVQQLAMPADLAEIFAAAKDYGERFVGPAQREHGRWDCGGDYLDTIKDEAKIKEGYDRAWDVYDTHCDVHRSIFSQILKLQATSPAQLLTQVEAYAAALDPYHLLSKRADDALLDRLDDMEVRELAVHMYENLKRMCAGRDTCKAPPVTPAGPNTPLAEAVALRDRLRAERSAYVDEHDEDCPREMDDAVGRAEHGVFLAPAANAAEALWKHAENMKEDEGCGTHAEALATFESTYGLEAAAAVGTYRDLERLAAAERPSLVIAALLAKLEELYEVERREGDEGRESDQEDTVRVIRKLADGILQTPGHTLADFKAKARAVEWAVSSDWSEWTERGGSTGKFFAASLVRELLGQEHPDVLVGREAISKAWTRARASAQTECEQLAGAPSRLDPVGAVVSGAPVADSELIAATEEFFRIDRLQNDTGGAMPSLTPLRNAALEKALTMPANSLAGLKSHLAIVRDRMPVEGAFEPDAFHDTEWRAVRALVDDVERLVLPAGCDDPKVIELERLLDQAIADRDFLNGCDHGLGDEEWTARDSIGEDAATAASYLEGDGTDLQRLRIKALGWFYRYDAGQDPKGFDLEERLAFRLFRSACKQSPPPAAVRSAPELLAAE